MSVGESQATSGLLSKEPHTSALPTSERAVRGIRIALAAIGAVAFALLVVGFFGFAQSIPEGEVTLNRNADGIVVLTGGAARISDAMALLASGRGKRLLISGVNPATKATELERLAPEYQDMFACCVDLDRSAVNTIGNAVETRRWARDRGFHSLVVVTSSYHMPRAMVELAHQLPDVTLIPFPVVPGKRRSEPWWTDLAAARLMLSEYLKYLFVVARTRLDFGAADTAASGVANKRLVRS
jgi:uncharacterized SAM-binding protein YcdF (DUF218 family)